MKSNEEIARSAANEWCRCFKCEGIVHDKEPYYKCEKPGAACWKWYDGYRTALIALDIKKREKETDLSLQVD